MSVDDTDKNFFTAIFSELKEDYRDIKNHLEKTCDELHEVDKNVTELRSELKNHLGSCQEKEDDKDKKHAHIVEGILVGIAAGATVVSVISITM